MHVHRDCVSGVSNVDGKIFWFNGEGNLDKQWNFAWYFTY